MDELQVLRELNAALEDRIDLKERKIAHLEQSLTEVTASLAQKSSELVALRALLEVKRETIAEQRKLIGRLESRLRRGGEDND